MANMSLNKTSASEQDPLKRNGNFTEVSFGYDEKSAIEEASRCLNCKNAPCVKGCPVNVQIPAFIEKILTGSFDEAYHVLRETNSFPAVCGRVCPQENQCEKNCVRGIKGEPVAIGRLERFAADFSLRANKRGTDPVPPNGFKAAVVGSGPAGLTCAGDLAAMGYDVTIFESFHTPGGVMVYGIPEFRLPKEIVQKEIENLYKIGVKMKTNMVIGKVLSLDELFQEGFHTIFLGTGAGLPVFLGIPGENAPGVYSANEFLTRINLMRAHLAEYDTPIQSGKHVAVVGGGNVAMDAARCAKRLGAEKVFVVYRRGEAQLPARREEVHHAREEGVEFHFLTNPVEILTDEKGWAKGLRCNRMELGEPDKSGRRSPVAVKDSDFTLESETVIVAVGTSPNPLLKLSTQGLEVNDRGGIVTLGDDVTTSIPGVFAGGDAVTGAATVILAMGAGKAAAAKMDAFVKEKYRKS